MLRGARPSVGRAIGAAVATTGLAYVVDYKLLPKRFTPGFELRLSRSALASICGVLAGSFVVGTIGRR